MDTPAKYKGVRIPTREFKLMVQEYRKYLETGGKEGQSMEFQRCILKNAQLVNFDFSGLDLSGVDFSNAALNGSDFTGANLTQALFIRAKLTHANFTNASLIGANLVGADLTMAGLNKANFSNADLTGALFTRALIREAYFNNSIIDEKFERYILEHGGSITKEDVKQKLFQNHIEDYMIVDQSVSPCFDVESIADVFSSHIMNLKDESGQMIGVFGHWGRGKTYFVDKVLKKIREVPNKEYKTVLFRPWKYQDTPATWAYLYETMYETFHKEDWKTRLRFQYSRFTKWHIWISIVIFLITALISFLLGLNNVLTTVVSLCTFTGGVAFLSVNMKKLHKTAIGILRQYTKKVSFNNVLGIQAEIEKELVRLLLAWIPDPEQKRVVLFVDDLDRCSQEKIIELVDSLRVMLDNNEIIKRLIVICACDEHKISMGIKYKYRDYCSSSQESDHIICEYLDKIFISGIKLPEISKEDAYEFVDKLMMCDNLTEPLVKVDGEVTPNSVDVKLSFFQRISKSLKQFMQRVHFIKEDTTIKVQNESKDVGENRNEIQNMSFGETNKLIKEQIALFKPCLTPRQIRILYYRYRLGHNLYMSPLEKVAF